MKIASEKDVKREVKKLLDAHEWFWFMPPANGYGKAGISDFLAIRAGVFLALETKFGGNKPTALQIGFLNSVQAEKGFAFVVSEKNLDWLKAFLIHFDNAAEAVASQQQVDEADGGEMLNAIKMLTELL